MKVRREKRRLEREQEMRVTQELVDTDEEDSSSDIIHIFTWSGYMRSRLFANIIHIGIFIIR